jgi:superfamily II DNA or RNA helicase
MPAAPFAPQTLALTATPRDYQERFIGDVFKSLDDTPEGSPALLYAAPTGTGKSVMELTLLSYLPDSVLVTPRLEIVADMLKKGGIATDGWGDDKLAAVALQHRITTPIRLRNMLARGDLPWRPDAVIWDEAHHRSADSYQDIRAYLGGGVAEIGLTASPFRGTPKGTEEFLAAWNSLTWVLTYPDAAAQGYIAVPRCCVWALCDDDELEVVNGEITVRSAEELIRPRLDEVVDRCRGYARGVATGLSAPESTGPYGWDRPTIFSVPGTDIARELAARLEAAGLPARAVTQDTPRADRLRIFQACERGNVAIVQIDVVSEGVDLKLRRLIDLRPTLSPVKWLQQVGRITRPVQFRDPATGGTRYTEPAPEYICTNRNLERHCYLYDGLIPAAAVAAAQQAFSVPSRRAGMRAVGTENLGRFQAAELPLADGTTGIMYQLTAVEGFTKREYAVLLHPCSPQPLYAARENARDGERVAYGKWQAVEKLPDMRGFSSAPAKALSDKQRDWWARAAKARGLDPAGDVNRRNFAALPILTDLGLALKGGAS